MRISRDDVMLLLVMSIAIVSMSFVFPAMGLSDSSVNHTEIPEFTIDEQRFDIAGDFPTAPAPNEGTIYMNTTAGTEFSNQRVWLDGNTDGGTELLIGESLDGQGNATVTLNYWNSSGVVEDTESIDLNDSNTRAQLEVSNGYDVNVYKSGNWSSDYYEAEYEVTNQPNVGGSFVDRIPVVGGMFEAADSVAGVVAWLTAVLSWFFKWLVSIGANMIGILYDVVSYLFGMASWLSLTYAGIVATANGWASVFVALPGIIFSMILAKFVVIGVKLLPTT